ncbi:hypothetical protein TPA0910_44480 [Streptomyces hygroscopicus subsp. sporocinereus]|uniref:Secreted protein n=1 Tax=Streptomyces hygroscopicus TaxID=1912 RepID=A0ABQ3U327_STRHY|nr:hypothetical protein [Streptomyces hygroscopicus]GHJ30015.1 hypothetical protein TPA0910_44480 [Streptomyces hygroscopicus]
MPGPEPLPLLLLDVDGPLNAYGRSSEQLPLDAFERPCSPEWLARLPQDASAPVKPLRVYLRRSHGTSLQALGFELCWATAWMNEANLWIGSALGLPPLPFIDFGDELFTKDPNGLHWKTRKILAYAQGRAFAWVDDELSNADRAYVAAHHDAPALLRHVDPGTGLAEEDFCALRDWAASLQ